MLAARKLTLWKSQAVQLTAAAHLGPTCLTRSGGWPIFGGADPFPG